MQGTPFYYMNIDTYPTFQNNIWKYENDNASLTSVSKYLYNPNINVGPGFDAGSYTNRTLYLGVYGYTATKYNIKFNIQGELSMSEFWQV